MFALVVRRGSFAAAAREHSVAPSTLSRAVASLEDELGVRLLQRTTRRLSLTEAGRLYFDRVTSIVDELDAAASLALDASTIPRGTLRITAPVSFAQLNLIPLLPDFRRQYPDIDVDLLLTDSRVDLLARQVDVAIRLGRLADTSLVARRLCAVEYVLCAHPDHPAPSHPSELENWDCLVFPIGGATTWQFRKGREAFSITPRASLSITNAIALRDAAVAGMGVLMTARWVVGKELAEGRLVRLLPQYEMTFTDFGSGASILLPSRAYVPLKVRAFVDYLTPRFEGGAPSG